MLKVISVFGAVGLLFIGILYGLAGITNVSPGYAALRVEMIGTHRGIDKVPLDTGMHWIDPLTNDVVQYDTRAQQYLMYNEDSSGIPASTKDGQPITADVSLEVSLGGDIAELHETIGPNYYQQVIYPSARSQIRKCTATQLSDEIYTGVGRSAVQKCIEDYMVAKLKPKGILIAVNLRDIEFTNGQFVATLERKAAAAQEVTIKEREAEAAINEAIRVANIEEGQKQKRIKAAEAQREELRLQGEGERLKQEETAKGILAVKKAEAEGARLQVAAYGDGKTYASVMWAQHMGPNVKVYGFPTGAQGTTSIMDLNGVLKGVYPK